jgi:hypothetical protein
VDKRPTVAIKFAKNLESGFISADNWKEDVATHAITKKIKPSTKRRVTRRLRAVAAGKASFQPVRQRTRKSKHME